VDIGESISEAGSCGRTRIEGVQRSTAEYKGAQRSTAEYNGVQRSTTENENENGTCPSDW
jgi:hypothetical protein